MRFFILIFSILLVSACSEPIAESHIKKITEKNKIRIGTLVGASTFYQGSDSELGFEYELAKSFADFLEVELEIVPFFNLSELFPRLNTGNIDLIASGLSMNEMRLKNFRFSPEYRTISQKLVFKQGNIRPRNFSQLSGNLTVLEKSSHSDSLNIAKQEYPELSWHETSDMDESELLQAIIDEKIDYTIADSHTLAVFRRLHPELSIGFSVTRGEPIAWMLANNNDDSLYALLIEFFGKMKKNGQLQALEEKYFGHVRHFNYINTLSFIQSIKSTLPKYQPWFEQYALDLDWRLLAALSYQESMWDPRAKSPTGVRGIMMITQNTAKQVGVTNRLEPEQNIRGGAKYLTKLLGRIPKEIAAPDRTWFALASYNLGWGHVNDARILAKNAGSNPNTWVDVKKYLPLLRKKIHYRKTKYGYARGDVAVTYVDNIRRYYDTLSWLVDNTSLNKSNK